MRCIYIMVLTLIVAGCDLKFETTNNANNLKPLATQDETRLASVQSLGAPHTYFVRVSIPQQNQESLVVTKRDLDGSSGQEVLNRNSDTTLIDNAVTEGRRYTYELLDQTTGSLVVRETVSIPTDIVYGGETLAGSRDGSIAIVAEQIFFLEKYPLITNGNPVTIKARSIFVEPGARIETFPQGQQANPRTHGRDGGEILIEADEIQGDLVIRLHGEDGGQATQPEPIEARPSKQAPGASSEVISFNRCNHRVGDCVELHRCQGEARDGPAGAQGYPGQPAIAGFNGGNAGSLIIRVKKSIEAFNLKIETRPGKGSPPSEPGIGGPGGEGGEPGATFSPCEHVAKKGPPGGAGPIGPKSDQWGRNGKQARICKKFPGTPEVCQSDE